MDEREFIDRADDCLSRVARWLGDFDPDELDYSTADGVVTMEFADNARFILSRNIAMKQMWLAAVASGYHYNPDAEGAAWHDDRNGHAWRFGSSINLHTFAHMRIGRDVRRGGGQDPLRAGGAAVAR